MTVRPILLVLLVGCARSTPPAASAPAPEAPPAPAAATEPAAASAPARVAPPLYVDMVGYHWTLTTEARDALVRGDLETARSRLAALGRHEVNPALPDDWKMTAYEMKAAAHEANAALTSGALGEALGQTVRRCGACHTTAGVRFEAPLAPPPEGGAVASHMQRHAWAVDRLWMSFVTGDEALWEAGLDALAEAPVDGQAVPSGPGRDAAVEAMGRLVHTLELDAREAPDVLERASVFGRLVATCGDCHGEARVRLPVTTP